MIFEIAKAKLVIFVQFLAPLHTEYAKFRWVRLMVAFVLRILDAPKLANDILNPKVLYHANQLCPISRQQFTC